MKQFNREEERNHTRQVTELEQKKKSLEKEIGDTKETLRQLMNQESEKRQEIGGLTKRSPRCMSAKFREKEYELRFITWSRRKYSGLCA